MKTIVYLFLIIGFAVTPIFAQSLDSALYSSTTGMVAQRIRLGIIAENVANITTLKVEETGMPYRKKYAVLEPRNGGVRVKEIAQSEEPFLSYPDGTPPQASGGAMGMPNINLPEEMLNMSYTEVMYEANLTCFKTTKALYQSTIDTLK